MYVNKLPAGAVEFEEGYYITPAAEVYKKVKNRYRKLNGSLITDGYLIVSVNNKNKYLHRIFAEVFIPNPTGSKHVYFKSSNKEDISIENLSWVYMCPNVNLLETIPADAKRYKEIYLVTKEAEIYKECAEGKCYKLNRAKLGKGKYYTVLIDNKREYVHKIYAAVYMNDYDKTKPIYFKDNNNKHIILENLTQDIKEKDFNIINYNFITCPVCGKARMQKHKDMCGICKKKAKIENKREEKRQNNKDLANKLYELNEYKRLTKSQRSILEYLSRGLHPSEIAKELGVSRQNVSFSIQRMENNLSKRKNK